MHFALPKTDCCNVCSSYISKRKDILKQNRIHKDQDSNNNNNNENVNTDALNLLEITHIKHLEEAAFRRKQMNIDYGDEKIDHNVGNFTIEYSENGLLIEEDIIDHIQYF